MLEVGEVRSSGEASNDRGAKGPQSQGKVTSGEGAGIGGSLTPRNKLLELQEALHAKGKSMNQNLVDESRMREIRTSGLMSGEWKRSGHYPATAPLSDSTTRDVNQPEIQEIAYEIKSCETNCRPDTLLGRSGHSSDYGPRPSTVSGRKASANRRRRCEKSGLILSTSHSTPSPRHKNVTPFPQNLSLQRQSS